MLNLPEKYLIAVVLIFAGAGCASTGGMTGPDQPDGDLVLRATGAGSWDVACEATTRRGSAQSDMRGRSRTGSDLIVLRDVRIATCTYNTADAPVTLTLAEEGLACPFGAFENEICGTVIPAGTSGTVEFSPE